MKKDEERVAILKHFKNIIEEKSLILNKKKSELRIEYKKYKQLVRIEKKLTTIFEQTYGREKLLEYKRMFQADKLKNKMYALYFQTKILSSQIQDLKDFFDKEYYNSMKHIAKSIYNKSKTYNFFNYKEKLIADLQLIVCGTSNEKLNKDLFENYNKGKEKINIFSI